MSGRVRNPGSFYGKWIWKSSLLKYPDSFALLRREFSCVSMGEELTLWISAVNTYQLFLNGRLVGFGPRAHHLTNGIFIDQHDLTPLAENGVNVITVLVSCSTGGENSARKHGFWCQLANGSTEVLCSDDRWLIRDGNDLVTNRPRFARDGGLTSVLEANKLPVEWQLPIFEPDDSWTHPDISRSLEQTGMVFEVHPLPPPEISAELSTLSLSAAGRIARRPDYSELYFAGVPGDGSCYAANGNIFCEQPTQCTLQLFADDPYKFFCGQTLVDTGDWSGGEKELPLSLRAGWNSLLFYQVPRHNAMGAAMVFRSKRSIRVQQEIRPDAPEGWATIGPLRMTLPECTSTLFTEKLPLAYCRKDPQHIVDPGDIFRAATLTPLPDAASASAALRTDDYRIYSLDKLRYGFIRVEIAAEGDDVVDFVFGVRRSENGFVQAADGVRGCFSVHCREGINVFHSAMPADCLYLGVIVRSARSTLTVNNLSFCELSAPEYRGKGEFHCSDEELNLIWETGLRTLNRSSAFVPIADSGESNDCDLLDAYIDAVNMSKVFGENNYPEFRLRRFLESQYESGEIPSLTFGKRRKRKLADLFVLPSWILANYRFSENRSALESAMEPLEKVRKFLESKLDDATGLFLHPEDSFNCDDPLFRNRKKEDVPVLFSLLFCRFLLSAADCYALTGKESVMRHCRRTAARVTDALKQCCFDAENGFFADRQISSPDAQETMEVNFFALLSGALPLDEFDHFFSTFFSFEPPYLTDDNLPPAFHFVFLKTLFALGQREWAMGYFREYWKSRLSREALAWKQEGTNTPAPTRFNGGGSVSPNLFLLQEILGIRRDDANPTLFYFNPAFREVRSAQGVIPLHHGKLMVRWEIHPDGTLDVTINATVPLNIVPELSAKRLAETSFSLSEQITLLAPSEEIVDDDDSFVAYMETTEATILESAASDPEERP